VVGILDNAHWIMAIGVVVILLGFVMANSLVKKTSPGLWFLLFTSVLLIYTASFGTQGLICYTLKAFIVLTVNQPTYIDNGVSNPRSGNTNCSQQMTYVNSEGFSCVVAFTSRADPMCWDVVRSWSFFW
jgi:hypothetical protein